MTLKETKSPQQILHDMKTVERGKPTEIQMEGATIKGAAPLSQERRPTRYAAEDFRGHSGSGDVFLETFMAGDEEVVLLRGSDVRKLSGIPGVKGFTTYTSDTLNSRLVGGPGDGVGWAEVPEEDFVSEEYARRKNQEIPPEPVKMINPQASGRALNNPRYEDIKSRLDAQGISKSEYRDWLYSVNEENPEWGAWYDKYAKNNPTYRNTKGSDGLATVYTPHVNVGGGFHFIPSVTVDGKPVYFFDDTGDLKDKESPGWRVRRLKVPGQDGSYAQQIGEYDASEVRADLRPRSSGKDIADAYKQASTGASRSLQKPKPDPVQPAPAPAPEPRPPVPSSFRGFEMPVVNTLKGRRRKAERRFDKPQELTDDQSSE